MAQYDAVIVGSGPNGLAAAIALAQAGHSVLVLEARESAGGGLRSAALTLPGFRHDVCSAVHPLALSSPFLRTLPLAEHGLRWLQPTLPLAHPFDDGSAAALQRCLDATADALEGDGAAYRRLIAPLAQQWQTLAGDLLAPLHWPEHPMALLRFAGHGLRSAQGLAEAYFQGPRARALFAGLAAHAIMPLDKYMTASFGIILGALAHAVGWPLPRGGAQSIADAMVSLLRSHGGALQTGCMVQRYEELPAARAYLFDVSPTALLHIMGDRLPSLYRHRLGRYRYGPGVYKIDWALSDPIPWRAAPCRQAGTVHLGATLPEIAASEAAVWQGRYPIHSYALVVQPSLFDDSRAPPGRHTAWAYCHVPNGSVRDMTEPLVKQVERFAPGFRDCILATSAMTAADMQAYNANYVGGDINCGVQDIWQQFARPLWRRVPYATPLPGVFLCSSATPPGGGVHGMCGYHAAQAALRYLRRR